MTDIKDMSQEEKEAEFDTDVKIIITQYERFCNKYQTDFRFQMAVCVLYGFLANNSLKKLGGQYIELGLITKEDFIKAIYSLQSNYEKKLGMDVDSRYDDQNQKFY